MCIEAQERHYRVLPRNPGWISPFRKRVNATNLCAYPPCKGCGAPHVGDTMGTGSIVGQIELIMYRCIGWGICFGKQNQKNTGEMSGTGSGAWWLPREKSSSYLSENTSSSLKLGLKVVNIPSSRGENHGDRKFFLRCLLHRRLLGHKLGHDVRRRHLSHGYDHLLADPCAHARPSRVQIPDTGVLNDCQIPLMGPTDPRLLGFRRVGYTPPV